MDGPGNHSHVFISRMHMGRHLITGGDFDPVYERALLGRITEENGHLGPLRKGRRRGAPLQAIRRGDDGVIGNRRQWQQRNKSARYQERNSGHAVLLCSDLAPRAFASAWTFYLASRSTECEVAH